MHYYRDRWPWFLPLELAIILWCIWFWLWQKNRQLKRDGVVRIKGRQIGWAGNDLSCIPLYEFTNQNGEKETVRGPPVSFKYSREKFREVPVIYDPKIAGSAQVDTLMARPPPLVMFLCASLLTAIAIGCIWAQYYS